jgi:hypothetical protein
MTSRRPRRGHRSSLTLHDMIQPDPQIDLATWLAHRHLWPEGNIDTAPEPFWRYEAAVPDELRGQSTAFDDVLDVTEHRRAWLQVRGGNWKELLDDDEGEE